jgi:hypothetical protein
MRYFHNNVSYKEKSNSYLYYTTFSAKRQPFLKKFRIIGKAGTDGPLITLIARIMDARVVRAVRTCGRWRGIADCGFSGRDLTDSTDSRFGSNADLRGIGKSCQIRVREVFAVRGCVYSA